jgi:hypothetical protein
MLNEQYQSQYVSTDWESNAFSDNNWILAPLYVFVLVSHLLFCALRNIFYEILISPKHLNVAELNSNLINFRLLSNKIIVVFVWNKVKRSPFLFNLKERKLSNKKNYWSKKIYNLLKCNRKYHFISISTSHYITPGPYYVPFYMNYLLSDHLRLKKVINWFLKRWPIETQKSDQVIFKILTNWNSQKCPIEI